MGPAVLLLLMLAAAAPLLLAAQSLDYNSTAKPSTTWINNEGFFSYNYYIRNILNIEQPQAHPGVAPYITAGFLCVPYAQVKCDEFLFGVSIGNDMMFSPQQVVWSANRDHPVRENATLKFTTDGNLVLRDADGTHVLSSNTSGQSVEGMKITEIGNLVLFDHKNATVWQLYFGYNMQIGNISIDEIIKYPTKIALMDGNLSFMLGPYMINNITLRVAQSAQFMRLDSDGYLRLYEWSSYLESWTVVSDILGSIGNIPGSIRNIPGSIRMDVCDYPTVCGEYGVCTGGQCTCPTENNSSSSYFKPVDERKVNLGCTPLTPVSCQDIRHHRLLTIPNISYFDISYYYNSHTPVNETSVDALKNCSCMAVLFRDEQCVWVTKVFSMKSIEAKTIDSASSAYLKVQLRPSNGNKKKVMFGATLGAVTNLVLLTIVVALYLRRRRKYEEKDEEFDFDQLPGMPTRFSFEMLRECTEGFSKKLGEGGFGSVFEGKLGEDRVAVKRLEGARQRKKEFLAEVETIGSIEHINLIRLIGFCAEKSERLLVYEYVPRGSLDRWIYYRHNNAPLDWCTRCRIILDIAKGLCYLHEDCRQKIAHLDIKPQNILLDDNFNAKVADFGLCKLINRDQSKVVTMMRVTPRYLAPEWLTSAITEKVDVYSFGVVIMEIISGRKNIDSSQPEDDVHLINLLREKEENDQLIDLIDKHSDDMVSRAEEVIQMMKLAVWCLQNDCTRRPSMSTVINVLEGTARIETFDANSIMFVHDNPSAYSAPSRASILSGPR